MHAHGRQVSRLKKVSPGARVNKLCSVPSSSWTKNKWGSMCLKLKLSSSLKTRCKAVVEGKILTVLYSISGSIMPVYIRKRQLLLKVLCV